MNPTTRKSTSSPYPKILDFIDGINSQIEPHKVGDTFGTFVKSNYGIQHFVLASADASRIERWAILASSESGEFIEGYKRHGMSKLPQILLAVQEDVFEWNPNLNRAVMDQDSPFGMSSALVFKLARNTSISAISSEGAYFNSLEKAELHLASLYAHARLKSLMVEIERGTPPLSARERECLEWVAIGKSDWEIGEILAISEKTVSRHLERVKRKLGVPSRVQAVVLAIRAGQISI